MSKLRMVLTRFLFVLMIISITLPWRSIPEYNIETDYGLPFIWGTKIATMEVTTTENFVYRQTTGHATWRVNPTHLLFDILFWSGLITIASMFPTKLPRLRISIDRLVEKLEKRSR